MKVHDDCRSYVTHIIGEHRRLRDLFQQARVALARPDSSILDWLHRVREELERHFAQEDAGGCMEEAVLRRPHLSSVARCVQQEHPELLRQLDRIIAEASASADEPVRRIALANSFEAFCQRVHAHESAENALLRQGFGMCANDGGNEDSALAVDA